MRLLAINSPTDQTLNSLSAPRFAAIGDALSAALPSGRYDFRGTYSSRDDIISSLLTWVQINRRAYIGARCGRLIKCQVAGQAIINLKELVTKLLNLSHILLLNT